VFQGIRFFFGGKFVQISSFFFCFCWLAEMVALLTAMGEIANISQLILGVTVSVTIFLCRNMYTEHVPIDLLAIAATDATFNATNLLNLLFPLSQSGSVLGKLH
jgi:hypothetical protein